MNKFIFTCMISVLPPVLVPRYSEYPSGMTPFQPPPEPSMPYNVSFPHGFPQAGGQGQSPHSPGQSSGPGSPFGVPGV